MPDNGNSISKPTAVREVEEPVTIRKNQNVLQNNQQLPIENLYPNVSFGFGVQVIGARNLQIGEGSCVGDNTWLNVCIRDEKVRMKIGRCVLIGRQSVISTGGFLEIADYCVLAPRVYVSDANHIFDDILAAKSLFLNNIKVLS